jgi:hypothetical protein
MFLYKLEDFLVLKKFVFNILFVCFVAKFFIIFQAFINCEENLVYFQDSQLVVNYSKLRYNYMTINDSFPVSMTSDLTNLFRTEK